MNEPKYYEAHVTIEPVTGDRLALFSALCNRHQFRVAELLMKRDREATEVRSDKDAFCTGRSPCYRSLLTYMRALVDVLRSHGFDVWRAKIEAVLLDERYRLTPKASCL